MSYPFTAEPLSAKRDDKVIFFLALSFKFWASFPQEKRNSPLYSRVLNRDISRSRDKAPPTQILVLKPHFEKIIQDGGDRCCN